MTNKLVVTARKAGSYRVGAQGSQTSVERLFHVEHLSLAAVDLIWHLSYAHCTGSVLLNCWRETMDNELGALTVIFTEFYYWVTVVLMFLIHVGFCLYEVGVSREKNKLNTLMKNSMRLSRS